VWRFRFLVTPPTPAPVSARMPLVTGASGVVGHYLHGHLGNSVSMYLDELQGKKGSTKKRRASRTS